MSAGCELLWPPPGLDEHECVPAVCAQHGEIAIVGGNFRYTKACEAFTDHVREVAR